MSRLCAESIKHLNPTKYQTFSGDHLKRTTYLTVMWERSGEKLGNAKIMTPSITPIFIADIARIVISFHCMNPIQLTSVLPNLSIKTKVSELRCSVSHQGNGLTTLAVSAISVGDSAILDNVMK